MILTEIILILSRTYSKQEQLIKQINDDKSKDKWLIFVASIQKGKDLLKNYKNNIDAVMIYKEEEEIRNQERNLTI